MKFAVSVPFFFSSVSFFFSDRSFVLFLFLSIINEVVSFITGHFDMLCPPAMAHEVASALGRPDALQLVPGAAAADPGMASAIRRRSASWRLRLVRMANCSGCSATAQLKNDAGEAIDAANGATIDVGSA